VSTGDDTVPLNEDEQKILEAIERQFYEEDPELARSVAEASLRSRFQPRRRVAIAAFVVGLVVMLASFTSSVWVAAGGFVVMLAAAGWFVTSMRRSSDAGSEMLMSWLEKARQRWSRNS
jgi:hypothetical protein